MIVSTDAEKAYNKIQHPFMIKTLSMLDTKGTFLNAVKALYTKPTGIIIWNGEKLGAFPQRSGTRQESFVSPFLFN